MNADGSGQRSLTPARSVSFYPAWSPDGRKIAFAGGNNSAPPDGIYVMNADGSGERRLAQWREVGSLLRLVAHAAEGPVGRALLGVDRMTGRFGVVRRVGGSSNPTPVPLVHFARRAPSRASPSPLPRARTRVREQTGRGEVSGFSPDSFPHVVGKGSAGRVGLATDRMPPLPPERLRGDGSLLPEAAVGTADTTPIATSRGLRFRAADEVNRDRTQPGTDEDVGQERVQRMAKPRAGQRLTGHARSRDRVPDLLLHGRPSGVDPARAGSGSRPRRAYRRVSSERSRRSRSRSCRNGPRARGRCPRKIRGRERTP